MVTLAFLSLGIVSQPNYVLAESAYQVVMGPVSHLWPSACQLSDFSVHEDDSTNTLASSNSDIITVHSFVFMATPLFMSTLRDAPG